MNIKIDVWLVWVRGLENDDGWVVYDLCLTQDAADKSMREGMEMLPDAEFYSEVKTSHS